MSAELATVKDILSRLKQELTVKYAVETLGLFGSIVRDDFTPESDIDIIVTFNRRVGMEFIDRKWTWSYFKPKSGFSIEKRH